MRTTLMASVLVAAAAAVTIPATMATGRSAEAIPAKLTSYGRLVWNFEGLAHRIYGTASLCEATDSNGVSSENWTRAACNRAAAYQKDWFPVFAGHNATSFTTTTVKPPDLGNVAPQRIAGRYIRCSASTWLVENSIGGWLCLGS